MKRAFILCRPSDFDMAKACQSRMILQGWQANIMIDPSEWETPPCDTVHASYGTKKRGMFGNQCANAIMAGMLANSQAGDVVMKMDCDVWLSDEASEWFSNPIKARTVKTIYWKREITWGGAWSATHEHLREARKTADTLPRCRCGEAFLNLRALYLTAPSVEIHEIAATQWESGERGFVATLPISKRAHRPSEGIALFS